MSFLLVRSGFQVLNQTTTSSFYGFMLLENNTVSCLSSLQLKIPLLEFAQVVQVYERCDFSLVLVRTNALDVGKKSPELSMSE